MDQIRNELMHYGVLGMKWGVRRYRNLDGSLTPAGKRQANRAAAKETKKLQKTAVKDAKAYAEAKMSYGKGAGIKRRHVKADVESKKRNPEYAKSFDEAMETINFAKATNKAVKWRKGEDRKTQTKRSAKATAKYLTGTSSVAAAGIFYAMHKPAVDRFVVSAAKSTVKGAKTIIGKIR